MSECKHASWPILPRFDTFGQDLIRLVEIEIQGSGFLRCPGKIINREIDCDVKYKSRYTTEIYVHRRNQRISRLCTYRDKFLPLANTNTFTYIGRTEGPFKTRYNCHMQIFTHNKYHNVTKVSKRVWELKDKNVDYDISSKLLQRAHPYKARRRITMTCVPPSSLNKISEVVFKIQMHTRKEIFIEQRQMNFSYDALIVMHYVFSL